MVKAVRIAGLGTDAVRIVEVDERPRHAARRARRPAGAGRRPRVHPGAGLRDGGDDVHDRRSTRWPSIGPICQRYGVWLHVDAAYAGVSAVVPELRTLQDGVEWADSYTTDAHKWLLTGFDATLFWVADRAALTGALSILPEYLRNAATDAGAVVDYRDWQIELGRRFRALKLWFVVRWYGAEGLRAHIRGHVALAQELAGWADGDERFDVVMPHPLSLVCLRPRWADDVDADVATMTLLERLNDGGEVFLTHTTVRRPSGAAGGDRRPDDDPRARRAGLGAAAREPRLARRRLRGRGGRARGGPGGRAGPPRQRESAPGRKRSGPAGRQKSPARAPRQARARTSPSEVSSAPVTG